MIENLKCFANKRKCQAIVSCNNCKEKELLTKKHFEVKLSIYDKASKNFDKDEMIEQYNNLLLELNSKKIEEIDPMDFQIITGKLEAIGELIIKIKSL
jgi:hypothetical protein